MNRRSLTRGLMAAASLLVCTLVLAVSPSAAQSVPTTTGSLVLQPQAQQALDFHNLKRHEVGASPLQWSSELAAVAQAWANHLASTGCQLQHTQHSQYGENLFGGSGMSFSALDASKDWFTESAQFKYGILTPTSWAATGHYTQMVWDHSTQMGMGQVKCTDGTTLIVAEYNPPGNYIGQAPYRAPTQLPAAEDEK